MDRPFFRSFSFLLFCAATSWLLCFPRLLTAEITSAEAQRNHFFELAKSCEKEGRWQAALDAYSQAVVWAHAELEERTQRLGADHLDVAQSLDHTAEAYLARRYLLDETGREDENEARQLCDFVLLYEKAEWIRTRVYATPFHPQIARTLDHTAALWRACHPPMAEKYFKAAVSCREHIYGKSHQAVADALDRYGRYRQGPMMNFKGARDLYRRALVIRQDLYGPAHLKTIVNMPDLARVTFYAGDRKDAQQLIARAVQIIEAGDGSAGCDAVEVLHRLGGLADEMSDPARARDLLERALADCNKCSQPLRSCAGAILLDLARVERNDGRLDQALRHYRASLEEMASRRGKDHPSLKEVVFEVIGLYEERGEQDQARELERRYQQLLKSKP